MKSYKIYKCRACSSNDIKLVFSLGNIAHAGIFPRKKTTNVTKDFINIVYCKHCTLVQLDRNFDLNYMFGKNYGYKSGINKTMTSHLKNLTKKVMKKFKLNANDYVLDIASNDATLLNSYDKNLKKVGFDPLIQKFKKHYKNIDIKISRFFEAKYIERLKIPKFKIITALSVLYDLPSPNMFIQDVKKILHKNGVFIVEVADLYLTFKKNIFDTFCHEHLEYYSLTSLKNLIEKNNLKIFDHEYLSINGGSSRYYITHKESKIKIKKKIKVVEQIERKNKVSQLSSLIKFFNTIKLLKQQFNNLMSDLKKKKFKIHGYGASTKGNILIQFYNIDNKTFECIAEKNKEKFNCFTPGSKIKIISEKLSRKLKPDYYVVLPWHFKKEILIREKKIRKNGTKFIFPLPKIEII